MSPGRQARPDYRRRATMIVILDAGSGSGHRRIEDSSACGGADEAVRGGKLRCLSGEELVGRHGPVEVEALPAIAAERVQHLRLAWGLEAFGDRRQRQAAG